MTAVWNFKAITPILTVLAISNTISRDFMYEKVGLPNRIREKVCFKRVGRRGCFSEIPEVAPSPGLPRLLKFSHRGLIQAKERKPASDAQGAGKTAELEK